MNSLAHYKLERDNLVGVDEALFEFSQWVGGHQLGMAYLGEDYLTETLSWRERLSLFFSGGEQMVMVATGIVSVGSLTRSAAKVGNPIARIMPGSLPAAEEAALLRTLKHIDAGTTPTGSLAKKWGTHFKNWDGDLPGASGPASPYREYRVAPASGVSGAGTNRVVVNSQTGEMYYTWTHYGDTAAPAFVKIR
jgi:guanyl-specific ribonuclease Sa